MGKPLADKSGLDRSTNQIFIEFQFVMAKNVRGQGAGCSQGEDVCVLNFSV